MREALDAYLASNSTDVPAEEVGWRARPLCATGHFARPATLPADAPRARGAAGGPAPRGGGGDRGRAPRAAGRGQRAFLAPPNPPRGPNYFVFQFCGFQLFDAEINQRRTGPGLAGARARVGRRGACAAAALRRNDRGGGGRVRSTSLGLRVRTRRVMAPPPLPPHLTPKHLTPNCPPHIPRPPVRPAARGGSSCV